LCGVSSWGKELEKGTTGNNPQQTAPTGKNQDSTEKGGHTWVKKKVISRGNRPRIAQTSGGKGGGGFKVKKKPHLFVMRENRNPGVHVDHLVERNLRNN